MATVTRTDAIDTDVYVIMSYDDIDMQLTGFTAHNGGSKTLRINITSPITISKTVNSGDTLTHTINKSNRPTYRLSTGSKNVAIKIDIPQILDIEWNISYGV